MVFQSAPCACARVKSCDEKKPRPRASLPGQCDCEWTTGYLVWQYLRGANSRHSLLVPDNAGLQQSAGHVCSSWASANWSEPGETVRILCCAFLAVSKFGNDRKGEIAIKSPNRDSI